MTARRVRWLQAALADLEGYAGFTAQDAPDMAQDVARSVWDAAKGLSLSPDRGRPGRVPVTRELVLTTLPMIIAYRVQDGDVQILRVLHQRRRVGS